MTAHSDEAAFGILLSDLLQSVLSAADSPSGSAGLLAERLRHFVGVKTVLVFQCLGNGSEHLHRLISAVPERRRSLADSADMQKLVELAHELPHIQYFCRPEEAAPEDELLRRIEECLIGLDAGLTIIIPLLYENNRSGVMFLFGLMDEQHLGNLVSSLDKLAGVLALVLRNGILYETLEARVQERTRELEHEKVRLQKALDQNTVLFKEVHHRVKNNLQIVDSLLHLQSSESQDASVQNTLNEARNRISAMALVHAELYQSEDFSSIDLASYIPNLVHTIASAAPRAPRIQYSLAPTRIPLETSIPLGLIINELVTNSLKYGLRGTADLCIAITLESDTKHVSLHIGDNGPGLPDSLDPEIGGNLGLSIIRSLVGQVDGSVSWSRGPGLVCRLEVPLSES
ncbi:MAG: sensor histidine kinase [Spirochaetes bacterium]|nr:sensor histidine kinase [Spirochaetota bacterium]MBU0955544.1 sensor histidine kinase [Spirochaetota bacterium]